MWIGQISLRWPIHIMNPVDKTLFSVFMWRHHFPKVKIANPSAVLVSSDVRSSNYLTFWNVSARQVLSICLRGRLNFSVFEWRDSKWQHEMALALVKRGVIAHVLANWTVLTVEEVLLSICRHSRGIVFCFNGKTHWQMFLLLYGRHVGAPRKGTNMAFPYKAL